MAISSTPVQGGLGQVNYLLGGPSRVAGESPAEAMTRGITADQTYRTTQLNQANTLQQMALARSQEGRAQAEEARRQQEFERRQRELARAAAEAATRRAADAESVRGAAPGVRVPGPGVLDPGTMPIITPGAPAGTTPTAPTAPVTPITPVAPPTAAPVTTGGLRVPTGGVQVASLDPTESYRLAFETNPELFGIQVADASGAVPAGAIPAPAVAGQPTRVDFSGVQFDVFPDGRIVNALTGTELPATGEYDALRNRLLADAGVAGGTTTTLPGRPVSIREIETQGSEFARDYSEFMREDDITRELNRVRRGLLTGQYGPGAAGANRLYGYFADDPVVAARRDAVSETVSWLDDPANERLLREDRALLEQFAADPVGFAARQRAAAGEETPPTETPPAETVAQTPEGPVVQQPDGAGLRLDTGSPVQVTQSEAAGEGISLSEFYLRDPNRVYQDANALVARRARLDNLYTYYTRINDPAGLMSLAAEYEQLAEDEGMLNGQIALAGIQDNNFGPYQMLLQQRFPGRTVEVRPYTDGTLDVFIDGQAQYPEGQRPTFADVLESLASAYNTDYINRQNAIAERALARSDFAYQQGVEQSAIADREIAVAAATREATRGTIEWSTADTYGQQTASYVEPVYTGEGGTRIGGRTFQLVRIPEYPFVDVNGREAPGPAIVIQGEDGQYSQPVYIDTNGLIRLATQ